ncbi:NAD(P)-binding domain-containing protein [Paroceanicella profunda]|uniref:NAD(P)-binding domain-containing protein n=1 Tax=Paroceanicella profunda TaxID=2579971 RepID=UPI00197FAB16|nr:NAD(P)/FAD-dependent oxidoreductase [Paroceanicella profunda]
MTAAAAPGLAALENRLRRDLAFLEEPAKNWVPARPGPEGRPMLDVAILGAGMAGIATAIALLRRGIRNIRLFDKAEAGREGPWVTYARMRTLRSPKHLSGPCVDVPALTFRAWFEAQWGAAEWEALGRIPRVQWMDYLDWLRRVTGLRVENGSALTDLAPAGDGLALTFRRTGGEAHVTCRHLVLANGRDGLGGPWMPAFLRALPGSLVSHSADDIDFAALAGRDVAVIGASASAVDNAAEALEAGARRVVLLVRRPDFPRVNKSLAANSPGFARGFRALPPEARWALNRHMREAGVPPPKASVLRCTEHPAFAIRMPCPVTGAAVEGARVRLETGQGPMRFDHVIAGTGFTVTWAARPELARLAPAVRLWRDLLPDMREDAELLDHPDLGPGMEFLPRQPGRDDWVSRITCMNNAAMMSHGRIAGDIPGISIGAQRVADQVLEQLFTEDWPRHFDALRRFDVAELTGDEWQVEDPLEAAPGD